jgi:monoterpene epsilon-lactone hydrolase
LLFPSLCIRYTRQTIKSINKETKVILYFHGGGFAAGTARQMPRVFSYIIKDTAKRGMDLRILSIEYTLLEFQHGCLPGQKYATEHSVNEAMAAYDYCCNKLKIDSNNIIIAGDSAGGNLAAVVGIVCRDTHRPMPRGTILLSPWTDVSNTLIPKDSDCRDWFHSHMANKWHEWFCKTYEGQHKHPYQSPYHADLHGLPPMYIWYAKHELLYATITQFVEKAKAAGVVDKVICDPRLFHVAPIIADWVGGESWKHLDNIIDWIEKMTKNQSNPQHRSLPNAPQQVDNEGRKDIPKEDRAKAVMNAV